MEFYYKNLIQGNIQNIVNKYKKYFLRKKKAIKSKVKSKR